MICKTSDRNESADWQIMQIPSVEILIEIKKTFESTKKIYTDENI